MYTPVATMFKKKPAKQKTTPPRAHLPCLFVDTSEQNESGSRIGCVKLSADAPDTAASQMVLRRMLAAPDTNVWRVVEWPGFDSRTASLGRASAERYAVKMNALYFRNKTYF